MTVQGNPSAVHWNVENGYQSNVNESEVYPFRVFGSNIYHKLLIDLTTIMDDSFMDCNIFTPGFYVSLHPPDEFARLLTDYSFVPIEKNVRISVKPKVTATSNGLRHYDPHDRGCYFKSERRLRFFRSYNQANCELECLANYTRNECGCIRFWMPSEWFESNNFTQKKFLSCVLLATRRCNN